MNLQHELAALITRRQLFGLGAKGIGLAALSSMLKSDGWAQNENPRDAKTGGITGLPHFAPKVKRVIYLDRKSVV